VKKFILCLFALHALLLATFSIPVSAQETKVAIGMSGWTGFAPLTLAKEAGFFRRYGLDVTIKKIPQRDRHLALASGEIQCAATTAETWIVWNANGVATTQIFQLDKSFGADGMVVKPGINSIKDLKGKTVAASAPGTAPYFTLAWMLRENGMSMKDVKVVNLEPQAAANAMIAGTAGIDAAMTYEPFLSAVRAKPEAGRIIATTLDYPMIMDTFGCTPKFLAENPRAAKALADAYFDAVAMIKVDPRKSFEIMGADVKQTAEQFEASQRSLRWQDREANRRFFASEHAEFSKIAAEILMEGGIIRAKPDMNRLADARFQNSGLAPFPANQSVLVDASSGVAGIRPSSAAPVTTQRDEDSLIKRQSQELEAERRRRQELEDRLAVAEARERERLQVQAQTVSGPPTAQVSFRSERRVALVVGNAAYKVSPLDNPVNDATDVEAGLKLLGFQTTLLRNASLAKMREATRKFAEQLPTADVALIYFAGHGVESKGRNYMIPTDADLTFEYELADQAYDASNWLEMLESVRSTNFHDPWGPEHPGSWKTLVSARGGAGRGRSNL